MDWLTFWSKIVSSLVWPAVLVYFLRLYKDPISILIRRIKKASALGAHFTFSELVTDALKDVAKLEPPRVVAATGTAIGKAIAKAVGRALPPKPKTLDLHATATSGSKATAELTTGEKPKSAMGTSWTLTTSSGRAYAFDVPPTVTPKENVIESFKALERILLEVAQDTGDISTSMLNTAKTDMVGSVFLSSMKHQGHIPDNAEELFGKILQLHTFAEYSPGDAISEIDARAYQSLCQQFAGILVNVADIYEKAGHVPNLGSNEPELR